MTLTWTMIKKDWSGMSEVTVLIDQKKEYTFVLKTDFEVEEFKKLNRFNSGKALNYLKDRNVKVEKQLIHYDLMLDN